MHVNAKIKNYRQDLVPMQERGNKIPITIFGDDNAIMVVKNSDSKNGDKEEAIKKADKNTGFFRVKL